MDDLISRQQAIDAVQNRHMMLNKEKVLLINDLEKLPSVEPKRGKWESQSGGGYCCSECGRYAMDKTDGRIVMISVKSKFCPNCGAKMEVTT